VLIKKRSLHYARVRNLLQPENPSWAEPRTTRNTRKERAKREFARPKTLPPQPVQGGLAKRLCGFAYFAYFAVLTAEFRMNCAFQVEENNQAGCQTATVQKNKEARITPGFVIRLSKKPSYYCNTT
jgi:hypothetical protein